MSTQTREVQKVTFPDYGISGHQWLSADSKYTFIALENTISTKPGAIGVVDNSTGKVAALWTYPGGPWPHGVYYEASRLR
jgi:hypothetical protein